MIKPALKKITYLSFFDCENKNNKTFELRIIDLNAY